MTTSNAARPTSPDPRFPYLVRVRLDGETRELWVDQPVPKGDEFGFYEGGWSDFDECLTYCERCTDASRPGSTRDFCMTVDSLSYDGIALQLRPSDFV